MRVHLLALVVLFTLAVHADRIKYGLRHRMVLDSVKTIPGEALSATEIKPRDIFIAGSQNRRQRRHRDLRKCGKGLGRCRSEDVPEEKFPDMFLSFPDTGEDTSTDDHGPPSLPPIDFNENHVPTPSPIDLEERPVPGSESDTDDDCGSNTDDDGPSGTDDEPNTGDDEPSNGDDEPNTGDDDPPNPPLEDDGGDDDGKDPSNDDVDYEELDDDEEPPSNDSINIDDVDRDGDNNSTIPIDDPDEFVTNEDYPIDEYEYKEGE